MKIRSNKDYCHNMRLCQGMQKLSMVPTVKYQTNSTITIVTYWPSFWIWSTWSPHSESDRYRYHYQPAQVVGEEETWRETNAATPLSTDHCYTFKRGIRPKVRRIIFFVVEIYIVFKIHFELRLSGPWQSENEGRDAGGRISWPSVHLHTAQESNHANYFPKPGQITCNIYSRIQILIKYFSGNFCHKHKTDGTKASKVQKLLPNPTRTIKDHDDLLFF